MRVNDFKINEDAKMAKATDEKIIALLMQFSKMDLSSPANEFMFKRVRKEFKKRNISLSPEQMKSFIDAQRSIDKVKIGEDINEADQYSASNSRALMVQLDNMHTQMQKKVEEIYATDNGDLQDQITTMLKVLDNLNSVIARAMKIIPAPQYDSKYNEETDLDEELTFENYALAAAEAAEKGEKEFEYPKGSGKMHPVTISDKAAKKITDDIHAEGYSKHKKGTPKYKRHMAAMHAAKG
jgi:hypothetical protein